MAKIKNYTDPKTGANFSNSYWNSKYYQTNLRAGQESVIFWFDGFAAKDQRLAGKQFLDSVSVTVPTSSIPAYVAAHLVDKKTLPELAYTALAEFGVDGNLGFFDGAMDDVDPGI